MSIAALWYRHTDKADKQLKDDLGELEYHVNEIGNWSCYSKLYPELIGTGKTSSEARIHLYKELKNVKR